MNFRRSTLGIPTQAAVSTRRETITLRGFSSDTRTLAATVEEGTAPKPVQVNAEANDWRSNSGNAK